MGPHGCALCCRRDFSSIHDVANGHLLSIPNPLQNLQIMLLALLVDAPQPLQESPKDF